MGDRISQIYRQTSAMRVLQLPQPPLVVRLSAVTPQSVPLLAYPGKQTSPMSAQLRALLQP